MPFTNAQYLESGFIACERDGVTLTVPPDPGNTDYADLMASGVAIHAYTSPPPTADDVRAEASRRMQIAFGARDAKHLEMIIANANREAIRLLRKGSATWTTDEATRAAQLEGADKLLEAIRVASNKLEPLDPIPDDYADDKWWTT